MLLLLSTLDAALEPNLLPTLPVFLSRNSCILLITPRAHVQQG